MSVQKAKIMAVSGATFSEAVHDFVAQNSGKKKTASFIRNYLDGSQVVTSQDVQNSIVRLEEDNSQRISPKIRPIFEAVSDYDGIIGTLSMSISLEVIYFFSRIPCGTLFFVLIDL